MRLLEKTTFYAERSCYVRTTKIFVEGIKHSILKVQKLTGSHFRIPAAGCDVIAVARLAHDPVGEGGDDRHESQLRKSADDPEEVAQAQSREA